MLFRAMIAFNVSCAIILLQLIQTRIFSVLFWNHLVYFIITIALLGFGISGTCLALGRSTALARFLTVEKAALAFTVSSLLSSFLLPHLGISISEIFELGHMVQMLFAYFAATLPYFFGGWILGILFRDNAEKINILYFFDLTGAAAGCLLYLCGIRALGATNLVLISCLLVSIPTLFVRGLTKWNVVTMLSTVFLVSAFSLRHNQMDKGIAPETTKAFIQNYIHVQPPDKKIVEFSEWNPISRIDVVSTTHDPNTKSIFIDGDAWTNIIVNPSKDPEPFDPLQEAMVSNQAPYLFHKSPESVFVIGAGGGIDVWNALRAGAKNVDAVEINSTTSRVGTELYRKVNNDLFHRKGVSLWNEEGRSFVRRSDRLYDVIMIHAIDTFAALNAGAYMLSENYLYTAEGIADYLAHLKPGGTLCITRWPHMAEVARLFTTSLEALYFLGVSKPETHIMAIFQKWSVLLIRKSPFSSSDIETMKNHAKRHKALFLFPSEEKSGSQMGQWLKGYAQLRTTNTHDALLDSFPFDVTPAYDDSPFFFHFEKWRSLLNVFKEKGVFFWIRGNWPSFTLASLFLASLIAVITFILVPLSRGQQTQKMAHFCTWLTYFACLGMSFIFVEIALMQRFALLLGHPSRSIALVLGTLLFSAGVGSYVAKRLEKFFLPIIGALFILIVSSAYIYPLLIHKSLSLSLSIRGIVTVALVFPLGFCMGMPFPIGIMGISKHGETAVPWMWGVNGGTTVLGSLLAIILAINTNFTSVLMLASGGYLIAALCHLKIARHAI